MLKQINLLLKNEKKLNKISKEFSTECNRYSDKFYIYEIIDFLIRKKM